MISANITKVIKRCPWCGGNLKWGESTCKEGATTTADCDNSIYVSRIGFNGMALEDLCTFRGKATRLANGEMRFTCSEEYYWQRRWKEVQYELPLKFPRRKPKG